MTFLELAKSRYSCRSYKPNPIAEEKLLQVLEAFRVSPSAVNYQPRHIIVVKSPDNLAKIHQAYNREWFTTAPMVLIVCGDHSTSWKRPSDGKDHADIDVAIAVDHFTLQATDLGLATCWVCNFNTQIIRQHFNLPEHIEPIALVPIGYPVDSTDTNRHNTKRKKIDDIVSWEKF
jgi:nitroreductase